MSLRHAQKSSQKRLLALFLGLQGCFLVVLILLSIFVNHVHKRSLANAVSISLRRPLIAGDLRTVINDLHAQVGVDFQGVQFKSSANGRVDFSVPARHRLEKNSSSFAVGVIEVPIAFSDRSSSLLGSFLFSYERFQYVSFALFPWGLTVGLFLWFARREQRKIAESVDRESRLQKFSAIAMTTQALAHDVRKPFSMFKMIIDVVSGVDDPNEAKQLIQESLPEVQQAMASVNGMIADVLEIGAESKLNCEPTNPESLIEATLHEIFRITPDAQINISSEFLHLHKVGVDTLKIGRVLSNIVGNAVQAINQKGSLWFKTIDIQENGKNFVQFCIGNSGSHIPESHLPKLFEAFFTAGKKGGTGLGLAIAHKIVAAHGGRIWCESSSTGEGKVEFFFTLPSSKESSDRRLSLFPNSSTEVFENVAYLKQASTKISKVSAHELQLEQELCRNFTKNGQTLSVLFVDDEAVYRNSLRALVGQHSELHQHMLVFTAQNSIEAYEKITHNPALVVLDVDLNEPKTNGYDLLVALRANGFLGVVCIHSNRASTEDFKKALALGADTVLPKPMSRAHLMQLLQSAAERAKPLLPQLTKILPAFCVVDDSAVIRKTWQRKSLDSAVVHTFESPEVFWEKVGSNQNFLDNIRCIITDHYFGVVSSQTGLDFGANLKELTRIPVFLSSNSDFSPNELLGRVDGFIPKEPISWDKLELKMKELSNC
jgi:signal transduction histidine kinase/DNA-binding response OmpR family regulator